MEEQFPEGAGHPATIEGIKRLAKELKRGALFPIKHWEALENASVIFGFRGYADARNVLVHRAPVWSKEEELPQSSWASPSLPITQFLDFPARPPTVRVEVRRRCRPSGRPSVGVCATPVGVTRLQSSRPTLRLVVVGDRRKAEVHATGLQGESEPGEFRG